MADYDDSKDHMTQDLRVRVSVDAPEYESDKGMHVLNVRVFDGPEMRCRFNPEMIVSDDTSSDDTDEGTLAHAVAEAVNGFVEVGIEEEARNWTEEHEHCFVVLGLTGLKAGHEEHIWPVKVFLNQGLANQLASDLNNWCKEHDLSTTSEVVAAFDPTGEFVTHPADPFFRVDGGTRYIVSLTPMDMTNSWR